MINKITINADFALVRNETLEGKAYKAIPMVMLKEAVLNGSGGPTFYPQSEINKAPSGWNYKPVTVYHPTMNGQGVTATDPVIIENQKIGIIMNSRVEDGLLKAEAWIDVDKANKVDPRVMAMVENGEVVEVSTGLFTDTERHFGTYDGKEYGQVARNFVPDHLAVLPDKKGALSVAEGAGLLRNEEDETTEQIEEQDVPVQSAAEVESITNEEELPVMANPAIVSKLTSLLALNSEEAESLNGVAESAMEKAAAQLEAEPAKLDSVEVALEAMTDDVRAIFNHGLVSYNEEKQGLIGSIEAASKDFPADFLANQDIAALRSIAGLIKNEEAPAEDCDKCEEACDECEAPAEEAPAEEAPEAPVENEEAPAPKFVGLAGIAADAVVINEDSEDLDMVPRGIDFSK